MAWSYRETSAQPTPPRPDPAEAGPPSRAGRRDRGWGPRDVLFWCGVLGLSGLAFGWLLSTPLPPLPTTGIALHGNLDVGLPVGAMVRTTVAVLDVQLRRHLLTFVFRKQGADAWRLTAFLPAGGARLIGDASINIAFRPDGSFAAVLNPPARIVLEVDRRLEPQTVHLDFGAPGSFAGLTQLPEAAPPRQPPVLIAFLHDASSVPIPICKRSAAPCGFSCSR